MKGELKKFAERMVDDHSNAGDELKTTAQNLGYAPSEKMAHQEGRRPVPKGGEQRTVAGAEGIRREDAAGPGGAPEDGDELAIREGCRAEDGAEEERE